MPFDYSPIFTQQAVERNDLVEEYFKLGFAYTEILLFLQCLHDIRLSIRQLKRILRVRGLKRRGNQENQMNVITAIESELNGSGSCVGYRQMHQRMQVKYGFAVARETVRIILKVLDPNGVETRSRRRLRRREYRGRGPNFIWHIDGYDKLKPYGFSVHAAIDGYSRRILWLEVSPTNKDPTYIARYFLDCIRQLGGVPRVVRADRGTENVNVCAIQRFLRADSEDSFAGEKSFMYGTSTSNQRIESWWSQLRKSNSDWWMEFFRNMRETGVYDDSNPIHVNCIAYCFMPILRKELNEAVKFWNTHWIRQSANKESPGGKPDVIYSIPELHNTENFLVDVTLDDVDVAEDLCIPRHTIRDCDENFIELADIINTEHNLHAPTTVAEAENYYVTLLAHIESV